MLRKESRKRCLMEFIHIAKIVGTETLSITDTTDKFYQFLPSGRQLTLCHTASVSSHPWAVSLSGETYTVRSDRRFH